MQHQHTLKGLGHNLSQKFRILFFFRFFMFRMVIINALSNFENQRFIELQAKYTEFIVIVYICVVLVYVQSNNVFLGGNNSIHVHIKLFYIVWLESFCQKK